MTFSTETETRQLTYNFNIFSELARVLLSNYNTKDTFCNKQYVLFYMKNDVS